MLHVFRVKVAIYSEGRTKIFRMLCHCKLTLRILNIVGNVSVRL